jgi:hypothetical protein
MTFQNLETATVLIFVLAAFIVAHMIVILVIISKVDQEMKRVEKSATRFAKELREDLTSLNEGLGRLEPVFRTLPLAEKAIAQVVNSLMSGAGRANQNASKGIESALHSIDEAGRKFEFALTRFSRQTTRVRRAVRYPTISAAALAHGFVTALRVLRKPKKRPMRHLNDGESFI